MTDTSKSEALNAIAHAREALQIASDSLAQASMTLELAGAARASHAKAREACRSIEEAMYQSQTAALIAATMAENKRKEALREIKFKEAEQ
jgi:hypothetical protein